MPRCSGSARPAPPAAVAAFRRSDLAARPRVLGHRGARQRAPENTLAAFDLALDEGADGVELDVRLDRSGEVVVLHDRTLARMTGGRELRDVETLGSAELATVELDRGERVPRLAAVLAWAEARGAWLNVELKHDLSTPALLVARVAALLRAAKGASRRVILSSFHPGIVLSLVRAVPAVPTALLRQATGAFGGAPSWHALGARGLHPEAAMVTPALVAHTRARGGLVNVWTVNGAERARALASLGVDGLVTDDPRGLLAALG